MQPGAARMAQDGFVLNSSEIVTVDMLDEEVITHSIGFVWLLTALGDYPPQC